METLFPVIFLGRAAENNVGPRGRVHDMRTMWSPYDQSCKLGGPASNKVGPEDRVHDMREMWKFWREIFEEKLYSFHLELVDSRISENR